MTHADEPIDTLISRLSKAPASRRLAPFAPDDVPTVVERVLVHAEGLSVGQLSRAMEVSQLAKTVADEGGSARDRSRARRALAQALAYANKFEEALECLEEGIGLAEAADERIEAARARLTCLHPLARLGRFDHAVIAGDAARLAFLDEGVPELAARADINLGVISRMRGDPAGAVRCFERAIPVIASEPALHAQLKSNLAEALLDLGRFEDAEQAFESALVQFVDLRLERGAAIVEGNLADLLGRQGRMASSLEHFKLARDRMIRESALGDAARLETERAEVLAALGLVDEAIEAFATALPTLDELHMVPVIARARLALGQLLLASGRLDEARREITASADAYDQVGNPTGVGRALIGLAAVEMRDSRFEIAADLIERAKSQIADHAVERALVAHMSASLELMRGRTGAALEHAKEAVTIVDGLAISPLLATVLHLRGSIHREHGDDEAARDDMRQALAHVENTRGMMQADRLRAAFLADRLTIYEDAFATELADERPGAVAAAFRIAELAKSRSLLERLQSDAFTSSGMRLADDGVTEVMRYRAELNALYHDVDTLGTVGDDRSSRLERIRDRERRLRAIEGELASSSSMPDLLGQPIAIDVLQRTLEPDEALIEYFEERSQLTAFILRHDSVRVVKQFASGRDIGRMVDQFLFQVRRGVVHNEASPERQARLIAGVEREAEGLGDAVFSPLADALEGIRRLRIVPHGPLHRVPFCALRSGGQWLLNRFEIVQAPSGSVHAQTPATPTNDRPALIIGVSDDLAPQAEVEARAIADALPGAGLLVGGDATIASVSEACDGIGLLHIASHARFDAANPLESGIRLSDGWLTVPDLLSLPLRGVRVVLSGCDTGCSRVETGDELMGVMRALLAAGASSLLASLWPVHDRNTHSLMVSVYKAWYADALGGRGLPAALRLAQLELSEHAPHPVSWAPFVAVGRPER